MLSIAYIETPLGTAELGGDSNGLQYVTLLDSKAATETELIPEELQEATSQLSDYFSGKRTSFSLRLSPQGTEFQKKVWHALNQIPFGKTVTYMDMAKKLGDLKVIRAAAAANGKNPIAIIIPCHRVIGSDGSLTGYASGLWRKQWLLEHESPVVQQKLF